MALHQQRLRSVSLFRYHIEMRHRQDGHFVRLQNDLKRIASLVNHQVQRTTRATLKVTGTELTRRRSVRTVTHINREGWGGEVGEEKVDKNEEPLTKRRHRWREPVAARNGQRRCQKPTDGRSCLCDRSRCSAELCQAAAPAARAVGRQLIFDLHVFCRPWVPCLCCAPRQEAPAASAASASTLRRRFLAPLHRVLHCRAV